MQTPSEDQAVDQVVDRMTAKYPLMVPGHIRAVVTEEHEVFAGNPVRSYVPVLVERQVKARLHLEALDAAS